MIRIMKKERRSITSWICFSVLAMGVTGTFYFFLPGFLSLTHAVTGTDDDYYKTYDEQVEQYMANKAGERTLAEYYNRRAYPGAPPYIPHPVETALDEESMCLDCHEEGGMMDEWGRYAPMTPHPQFTECRQCHVVQQLSGYFQETEWKSIPPPRLGNSQLPGSPPPIPHSVQMRTNCTTCHGGEGSVRELRVDHADRTECRQCHVVMVVSD